MTHVVGKAHPTSLAEALSAAGRPADASKSLQTAIENGLVPDSLHPFDLEAYRKLKESL